jgi:predicted Zn finger-like uncharacterized protein
MYSQCPECHARYRVSAGDLRAARGTVRCGRCGSAFNALAWLSDTIPPSPGDATTGPVPDETVDHAVRSPSIEGVEFHFTADDIESVFIEPQATGAGPPILVEGENEPFEDITLEGERISIESILGFDESVLGPDREDDTVNDDSQTDEFEVLRDVPDSTYPEEHDGRPAADAGAGDDEQSASAARSAELRDPVIKWDRLRTDSSTAARDETGTGLSIAAEDTTDHEASLAAALEPGPRRLRPSGSSLAWTIGCLLLTLVLLAQVTHQFRQELVRNQQLGPLLRNIYARIGWPLSPNWDLSAFELRQWDGGGGPDASGELSVHASLTNRAAFAQPHPILRLELDDRFGDAVAVRDFEPAEYLKNAAEASRLLGPGASAEAALVVVDPGQDAVGYQLDVCLRESAEVLRCARSPD